jgi:putative PIN family toxin of toxin-antitoxin system
MRIVLDTNVVVSALLWGGKPFQLLEAAIEGDVMLHTSPELLAELREILARPHLASRLSGLGSSIEEALDLYTRLAQSASPAQVPRVVADDPDDDHVIAAAVASDADLLVSGDRHLLGVANHGSIRVVSPAEALLLITR